jgi:hypothetical protein
MDFYDQDGIRHLSLITSTLSSAEPYEFLVKLRNITWETIYVFVSQNALGTFCHPSISPPPPPASRTTKCPLLSLHYPYKSYIIQTLRRRVLPAYHLLTLRLFNITSPIALIGNQQWQQRAKEEKEQTWDHRNDSNLDDMWIKYKDQSQLRRYGGSRQDWLEARQLQLNLVKSRLTGRAAPTKFSKK